MLQMQIE